jgi:SprT protein
MPLLRQLEFAFQQFATRVFTGGNIVVAQALRLPQRERATDTLAPQSRGRDANLKTKGRELLRSLGANRIAKEIRIEWDPRLKTTAGRADYRLKLISLNPQLAEFPDEIDRTLRHELAHILAQFRAGRRRISPHGAEWQQACRDLGIAGERRCHSLPFPAKTYAPRFIYRCPNCRCNFPRVHRIRRAVACLACCRAHNGGEFDARFRLELMRLGRRPVTADRRS